MAYRTNVYVLDNKSLLQIFSHYRLEEEDNWNLRLSWRRLAHVCRRWRLLIFDSSSHLDIRLCLTNDSPSLELLSHLLLPLAIDYSDGTGTMARKDEDNLQLGLRQQGQWLRRVTLRAPSSSFHAWLKLMNKLFPRLEDLYLLCTTTDELSLVLPETFQAPGLRHLTLHDIGLPNGFPLLSSTIALSTLSLTHIRDPSYLSPDHLVTLLQYLPYLEELSIGFNISVPLPSSEGELLLAPTLHVTPPTLRLRRLTFRGVDAYLDNLVAQINTPLLEQLNLTLLFDLTFNLVNLAQFLHRAEGLRCHVARVIFNKDGVAIDASSYEQHGIGNLHIHIYCKPLDWQIDSATQVYSALGNVLSAVKELTLDLNEDGMPSDWENTLDNILWIELLLLFTGMRKLHIGFSLILEVSRALGSVAGEFVLEFLPELQELGVQFEINHAIKLFHLFVEARESVGRPVQLLALPILYPLAESRIFPKYMDYDASSIPVHYSIITYLTRCANINIAPGPLATNI